MGWDLEFGRSETITELSLDRETFQTSALGASIAVVEHTILRGSLVQESRATEPMFIFKFGSDSRLV